MKGTADPGHHGARCVRRLLITTVGRPVGRHPFHVRVYNWLVHHLRVLTIELDNFAQDLVSRMERIEFLKG